MRTIKKEIEVEVCEICGKELDEKTYDVFVCQGIEHYKFHRDCVDDLLLERVYEAKKA